MRFTQLLLIVLSVVSAESPGGLKPTAPLVTRRAVLVGIDDYTASTIPAAVPAEHRGWPDLRGGANDVGILADMLVLLYGFERKNVITLTNQQATRAAILRSVDQHLVRPARKGDVVFFYFAGHGAQVPNAHSDEPDRLDESIVPADSRRGADDIRDKELRPLFNRILDRGARLTLLLDHCHSGGSFRGLPNGARPRGIAAARPIVDGRDYGPRPDERGALVLASTQDPDSAWEALGEDGRMHGAFTWSWIRALRDAVADEPAQETFLRAQARLRAETPHQAPAMLGPAEARRRPFLGTRIDRRGERAVIAVEKVDSDGSVVLQGGWAHGLGKGSELRPLVDPATRLRVTAILGLGRSVARMHSSGIAASVHSGALLEVVRWAAPQERPLRVWTPRSPRDVRAIARRFASAAKARWILDPLDVTPTHVLRPHANGWELLARDGQATKLATDVVAIAAISRLPRTASLFVQLPSAASIIADGIHSVDDPKDADYILAGRFDGTRASYAWIRPLARRDERLASGLPPRTRWTSDVRRLRRDLATLRRIHAWTVLAPPPNTNAPYRLALRHEPTHKLVSDGKVVGDQVYSVVLRAAQHLRARDAKRYYYVFVIDTDGNSFLAFPKTGSVENRFPIGNVAPTEIPLGAPGAFQVKRPYGVDTYVLLSTEEPLPNPSILMWDGVRATRALAATRWSIERLTFESVAPPRH